MDLVGSSQEVETHEVDTLGMNLKSKMWPPIVSTRQDYVSIKKTLNDTSLGWPVDLRLGPTNSEEDLYLASQICQPVTRSIQTCSQIQNS